MRPLRVGSNMDNSQLLPLPGGGGGRDLLQSPFCEVGESEGEAEWGREGEEEACISPAWPPSTLGSPPLLMDVGMGAGAQLWRWSVGLSWAAEAKGQNPNPHLADPDGLSIFLWLRSSRPKEGSRPPPAGLCGLLQGKVPLPRFPEYDSRGRNSLARTVLNA